MESAEDEDFGPDPLSDREMELCNKLGELITSHNVPNRYNTKIQMIILDAGYDKTNYGGLFPQLIQILKNHKNGGYRFTERQLLTQQR